jgi:lysophospholipase L1-like esterase
VNNGELDNLSPKVVVLLAGTNNVGSAAPADPQDVIADTTRGIEALLTAIGNKAPSATIILMGLFPRNDNMSVMPVIKEINRRIANLADGRKVRYLNINDKLADASDRLLDGMMEPDKLHPTEKTYQVWADALRPIFHELLGPPGAEDHAPPATGNPAAQR